MNIKIAVIQFQPLLGQVMANISRINSLVDRAGDAELIVLPELAGTGYDFISYDQAFSCSETTEDGPFLNFLLQKASEKNAFIVSGFNERSEAGLYNSSLLVGPEGIIAKYRKTHLFMNEKDIFLQSDGQFPVADIGGARIGMTICFDYLFPEIWRMQAMEGADIICHPSNLLTQNAHRCVPGLALMNRIFVITANRIGQEGELQFNGQSFVTDPFGAVVAKASADQEEVLLVTMDTDRSRDKWITPRNHAFEDRRPDIYT